MVAFEPDEKLLRAVRNWPNFWKKDGRISSAAFKTRTTETGTSVFRQAGRNLKECVEDVSKKLEGAVVSVTYDICQKSKIDVIETNPQTYHCELTDSELTEGTTALTKAQLQNLADFSVVEKK